MKKSSVLENFLKARTDKNGKNLFEVYKSEQEEKQRQIRSARSQGMGGRG